VDEIELFAELAPPPPAGAQEMQSRARARLAAVLIRAGAPTGAVAAGRKPRRRWRRMALGIAAVACAAIVVPAVLPGSPPTSFVTKAWAVQRSADGTVTLRVAQVAVDGSGLQRALDAAGVPALVQFSVVNDPSYRVGHPAQAPGLCMPQPSSLEPPAVQAAVVTLRTSVTGAGRQAEFVIHPSAMPPGSVLYISNVTINGVTVNGVTVNGRVPQVWAFTTPKVLNQDHLPACTP
jgi:hypothetical protein